MVVATGKWPCQANRGGPISQVIGPPTNEPDERHDGSADIIFTSSLASGPRKERVTKPARRLKTKYMEEWQGMSRLLLAEDLTMEVRIVSVYSTCSPT